MVKTALNVGSHHSPTGQRVLRKIVMEKWSGSKLEVWALSTSVLQFRGKPLNLHLPEQKKKKKKKERAFSDVSGGRASIPKGSPRPPFFHLNVSSAFESTE